MRTRTPTHGYAVRDRHGRVRRAARLELLRLRENLAALHYSKCASEGGVCYPPCGLKRLQISLAGYRITGESTS
jgi:hypothetical protein